MEVSSGSVFDVKDRQPGFLVVSNGVRSKIGVQSGCLSNAVHDEMCKASGAADPGIGGHTDGAP